MTDSPLPLEGVLVLDFSQFLAGPVAALRLADLGARVIKVERPVVGDIGRTLAFAGLRAGVDTISFHAMNRNKESVAADLKDPEQLEWVRALARQADVVLQNFRPGVVQRLGLDHATLSRENPRVVYGSITGYGDTGPWKDRPGQDLLAQSVSGIPWLQGGERPTAVGLSIADHLASCHLAQGITALLLRRERTGLGGHVETSLLESVLDLQFELLSAKLTQPEQVRVRSRGEHSAHTFLSAPYGIYPTADGYLSIAMNPVPVIGTLLELPELESMTDPRSWWDSQPRIEQLISQRLATAGTAHWLTLLDAADIWCAPVHTLDELVAHDGFAAIDMVQSIARTEPDGSRTTVQTTRSPLRIDGRTLRSGRGAPVLGADTAAVRAELAPDPVVPR
ncbi:CaiB/BaiF CoA transferase family protein [Desertihabitans aurantiacus]|uniref:CaiB/BaiF CoA transferase family protein n=1 Tax=Desertihabitans aurantiacus TaxID=2282477 RepID=UPI000DF78D40|nr:CaiB/BaiF CoA-transferase family protein [Desertihabitans aurantiacus]